MSVNTNRKSFLPYGRQALAPEDILAVTEVLQSDWWTQGPALEHFESDLAALTGAQYAVACSSGTAALHLAMLALGLSEGDEVVTSPNTFVATANAVRYVGAEVRFADIDPSTGNMDPDALCSVLSNDQERRIRAVIPVHFAGKPCDMEAISQLARDHGAAVLEDACHALGARFGDDTAADPVGSNVYADLTVFSFHPVKHVAAGEGGAITTNATDLADRLRRLRSHGIRRDHFANADLALAADGSINPWYYEMQELGFNYRLTDIQAALASSQMTRLAISVKRRREIATLYDRLLMAAFPDQLVRPLHLKEDNGHSYHLYVVQIDFERAGQDRAAVMTALTQQGIGTQVHYIPVPLQPYYRARSEFAAEDCAGARKYYRQALSLPMYPGLANDDVRRVIATLADVLAGQSGGGTVVESCDVALAK